MLSCTVGLVEICEEEPSHRTRPVEAACYPTSLIPALLSLLCRVAVPFPFDSRYSPIAHTSACSHSALCPQCPKKAGANVGAKGEEAVFQIYPSKT